MSLKQKISEQAKFAFTIYQDYEETRTAYMNPNERKKLMSQKFVSVDDVCGLLDEAITEIEAKAIRRGINYWENAVMLDDIKKILLGDRKQGES